MPTSSIDAAPPVLKDLVSTVSSVVAADTVINRSLEPCGGLIEVLRMVENGVVKVPPGPVTDSGLSKKKAGSRPLACARGLGQ